MLYIRKIIIAQNSCRVGGSYEIERVTHSDYQCNS